MVDVTFKRCSVTFTVRSGLVVEAITINGERIALPCVTIVIDGKTQATNVPAPAMVRERAAQIRNIQDEQWRRWRPIADAVANGRSFAAVGRKFGISPRRVKAICEKMGIVKGRNYTGTR